MPQRNSTLKAQPNITATLRKSPRLLLKNQSYPLDPKTPEPRSRVCRLYSGPSRLSSVGEDTVEKFSTKVGESKCEPMSSEKLNGAFARSGVEKPGFCHRQSPRLSGKENVIDGFSGKGLTVVVGLDSGKRVIEENAVEIVEKESNSKTGVPDEGRAIVAFDSSKSVMDKRVTRGSVQRKADEIAKKNNQFKKGLSDAEKANKSFNLGERTVRELKTEKRVTRGSVRGCAEEITKNKCKGVEDLLGIERSLFGTKSCNSIGGKLGNHHDDGANSVVEFRGNSVKELTAKEIKFEKRVTRSSIRGCSDEITMEKCTGMEDSLGIENFSFGAKSCNSIRGKLENHPDDGLGGNLGNELVHSCGAPSTGIVELNAKKRDIGKGMKTIGVKRKRNQDGDNHGWSQDQQLALQRAYFAAKPTPNFWKRVSKLVPGKSAQDCFNKVHADNSTPPQPRPRSRATKRTASPSSLSASKLLKPEQLNKGKKSSRKQKAHIAQKKVRQLLQKHYNVDQGYEGDLFSVLEPNFNPSTKSLDSGVSYSTPQSGKVSNGLLRKFLGNSSSALKKPLSRLGSSNEETFVSPPVLKPIKNKALHEKYIDQLHCREAKRKVACKKENSKKVLNQKTEAIKELKDSLVLDAKDFIQKFQEREDKALKENSDDDIDNECLKDDDEEDDFE